MTPTAPTAEQTALAARALETLRNTGGLIHCLTNIAAASFTADVLLALGARPSLTYAPDEVEGFASSADSLLVNLGTLNAERRNGILQAVSVMNTRQVPWVLDPVLCNRSDPRRSFAEDLLDLNPAVLRLNSSELAALTGDSSPGSAYDLARSRNLVVMLTGEQDLVTDGEHSTYVTSGHRFMDLGTAYGCAGGAVTATCLHVCSSPFEAALSSLLIFNLAGEITGRIAGGPGSFRPIFLDTLHMLETDDLSSIGFDNSGAPE